MGSYASEPKVDKESLDEYNDRLNCGACSMQGWRVSQEDAHNCLLNFDTDTSFFAVYDGHGGHEVAQYCAQKLPDFIKNTEAYKAGDLEKALIDGFLGFDKTITTPEVIEVLKEIAGMEDIEEDSDEEENVSNLYEEAAMPIEQVIEKYTSNLTNPALKNLKKGEKAPKSPFLKAKKGSGKDDNGDNNDSCGPSTTAGSSSSDTISSDSVSSSSSDKDEKTVKNSESSGQDSEAKANHAEDDSEAKSNHVKDIPEIKVTAAKENDNGKVENEKDEPETTQNGEITQEKVTSSEVQENGEKENDEGKSCSPKGKGKGKMKMSTTPVAVRVSPRTKQSPNTLYKKLLDYVDRAEEEESEDEDDVTFVGGQQEETSDDEEAGDVSNSHLEDASDSSGGEEEDEEEEEEEDDDDDDEDDCMEDDEDEMDMEFTKNMKDEPGSDSGCTAVVAVLRGGKLWVANAGDSRCVVCRNGKAIEMSFDHKPEDEPERARIVKAGGRVTMDGRVNNGLNLSRAIGDHAYKLNADLGAEEQMITALPDVKTLDLNVEEDEFVVLACDGIWNYMSSQEVVDYVRSRLTKEKREKVSSVCEELFDHCLAPNTMGDGTGCDNMTAIIIQFKTSKKRRPSEDEETATGSSSTTKRVKTDEEQQSSETTTTSSSS